MAGDREMNIERRSMGLTGWPSVMATMEQQPGVLVTEHLPCTGPGAMRELLRYGQPRAAKYRIATRRCGHVLRVFGSRPPSY